MENKEIKNERKTKKNESSNQNTIKAKYNIYISFVKTFIII